MSKIKYANSKIISTNKVLNLNMCIFWRKDSFALSKIAGKLNIKGWANRQRGKQGKEC